MAFIIRSDRKKNAKHFAIINNLRRYLLIEGPNKKYALKKYNDNRQFF